MEHVKQPVDQMHWLTTKLGRQRVTEHFATAEDDQSSTPL